MNWMFALSTMLHIDLCSWKLDIFVCMDFYSSFYLLYIFLKKKEIRKNLCDIIHDTQLALQIMDQS